MPFPNEKPFNPQVSKTPILGPSSGNPKSFQDPNSVASIGNSIQAMADQAKADTLYDTKPEGFRNETYRSVPWITGTESCKKEGFLVEIPQNKLIVAVLVLVGLSGILLSFSKKR